MTVEAYPLAYQIPLANGMHAIVDMADATLVSAFSWYAHRGGRTWYARADIGGRAGKQRIYLHRLIAGAQPGQQVDHRNHDGLDCRRDNLRVATAKQNAANSRGRTGSSAYRGVTWDASRGKWAASIMRDKKRISLGRFDDEEVAAATADIARSGLSGDFAFSNLGVHMVNMEADPNDAMARVNAAWARFAAERGL